MKYLFILLTTLFLTHTADAQYDDRFYFPQKKWENIDTIPHEAFFIKIDSAKLSGIMLKPKVKKPIATLLFFHGGGGNVTTYIPMVKPFVDSGFQVYMIDFRGFGKSTGKPTHINIAHDAQIVFNNILKRKDVKGTKIIVVGVSLGAAIATKVAKDNQAKITALVLEGPVSSFTDIAAASSPPSQKAFIEKYVHSPYEAKEDVKALKNTPTLIIHSTDDKDVPIAEGQIIYKNATGPKAFWEVRGGHLEAILYDEAGYIARMKAIAEGKLIEPEQQIKRITL